MSTRDTETATHTRITTDAVDATDTRTTTDARSATGRALVVIDVQESFRQRESWRHASDPDVAHRVARLVEHARAAGDLVVWVLHTEPGTGTVFDPAAGHVRLMAPLAAADGEPVLHKTAHNAFTTTNLQQLLTGHGVRALTTCGIRTEQCVETTTRLASDLGYATTIAIDATATEPLPDPGAPAGRPYEQVLADPRTLSPEAVIERTRYALAGRFATVATVEELTGS